jgi:hypothetical protein
MQHFIHSLYPGRIDILLKTGDRVILNRLWGVKKCPCLGYDYFHNRHHNVEVQAKAHKEMSANMQELG